MLYLRLYSLVKKTTYRMMCLRFYSLAKKTTYRHHRLSFETTCSIQTNVYKQYTLIYHDYLNNNDTSCISHYMYMYAEKMSFNTLFVPIHLIRTLYFNMWYILVYLFKSHIHRAPYTCILKNAKSLILLQQCHFDMW